MASLTVRNIPEDAKLRFRQSAAAHGRSMEEHLRQLVIDAGREDTSIAQGVRDVNQSFRHFETQEPPAHTKSRARIERLIRLANGAGEGLFEREKTELRDFDL